MKKLGNRSLKNLENVNPKLIEVVVRVLERGNVDFTITNGFRSVKEQQTLYAKGRTKPGKKVTNLDGVKKKSYHQSGKAIDFIPYPFRGWDDEKGFKRVGEELKKVSQELGYACSYGGDWKSFNDYPHFQIS